MGVDIDLSAQANTTETGSRKGERDIEYKKKTLRKIFFAIEIEINQNVKVQFLLFSHVWRLKMDSEKAKNPIVFH